MRARALGADGSGDLGCYDYSEFDDCSAYVSDLVGLTLTLWVVVGLGDPDRWTAYRPSCEFECIDVRLNEERRLECFCWLCACDWHGDVTDDVTSISCWNYNWGATCAH